MDRLPATGDRPAHVPAPSGTCAFASGDAGTVRRIGGDLLARLEQAGRDELAGLLTSAEGRHPAAAPDPVESVIAWDLAAGF